MRVLIADDHAEASNWLSVLVKCWGYEPVIAHDGLTALQVLRLPEAPTLAVLDWVMPGMNGVDVCREIRKDTNRPYIYLILVSGRGGREQMVPALEAGADDYLVKPVDPEELRARLNAGKRIVDLQAQLLATQLLLRQQATRDALTGLWNRAMILEILDRELARTSREGHPLAVIMADLDHFKDINDTHGHLAGDQVLRHMAQRLLAVLRPYDTFGRYGGEEFLVALPGCDGGTAMVLAERLRRCAEAEPVGVDDVRIAVTLSLGVAAWDGKMPANDLLRKADDALYQAKRAGRNQAVHAGDGAKQPPAGAATN
jgi:diguanylate cyclase (GGDEF)-like protein